MSPQKICPLVETHGREFGPQLVYKPFSLIELKQDRGRLRELFWRPWYLPTHCTCLWLNLEGYHDYSGTDLIGCWTGESFTGSRKTCQWFPYVWSQMPHRRNSVPPIDPWWNYNSSSEKWERDHFIICIKAGLRTGWQKDICHIKVTPITQGPKENPAAFLEWLRKALIKYINLDLSSHEG